MVSVTSASRYIMSASHYHPCYQSRSLMYIRGLIPPNFAELTEAVPIDKELWGKWNASDSVEIVTWPDLKQDGRALVACIESFIPLKNLRGHFDFGLSICLKMLILKKEKISGWQKFMQNYPACNELLSSWLMRIRFLLVHSQDIVLNECFSALDSAWQTLHILAVINDNRSGSVNDKILTQWVSSDCRSILIFEYIEWKIGTEKYSYFTTIFCNLKRCVLWK